MNKGRSIRLVGSSADSSPRRLPDARRYPQISPTNPVFCGAWCAADNLCTSDEEIPRLKLLQLITINQSMSREGSDRRGYVKDRTCNTAFRRSKSPGDFP